MSTFESELHCHTVFSDGFAKPMDCIRFASKKGINILAITDHNTAEGALPFWKTPIHEGVFVIPGEEVSTDHGHLLAYFIHDTIKPGRLEDVIESVHKQDGLAFMAHPYHIPILNSIRKKKKLNLEDYQINMLDGIEIENGHNRSFANNLAFELAKQKNKRMISGSDAHFKWEIGNARTRIDIEDLSYDSIKDSLLKNKIEFVSRKMNYYPVYLFIGLLNKVNGKSYSFKVTNQRFS